jgi:KUP system potassium uptake protein
MFKNNILYEDNIIVSIIRLDSPFGVHYSFKDNLTEGLRIFEIRYGYLEIIDVERIWN